MRAPGSRSVFGFVVGVMLATGCASTNISDRDEYQGGKLPRPGRIIVYDFAATPADLPAWSESATAYGQAAAPMSADQIEEGRKLGADLAGELVRKINDMGITAVRAQGQAPAQQNDLAIVGYFLSVDPGSAEERVLVGFGQGAANVNARVEGYRMTDRGMQRLGGGTVDSGGGKSPGLVVPALVTVATANPIGLAVSGAAHAAGEVSGRSGAKGSAERIADEIAEQLQMKFEEQGWI